MKIPRDKEFGDVLVRKEAFLDNRNIDFRKRKIFPKGIVHDFGKETIEGFSWIVFIKNRSKKVFADVLDRKKVFKDWKKIFLWKSQNKTFSKGVK